MPALLEPRTFPDYLSALRVGYEEEISGEAYFARLASFHHGRAKAALSLLAEVERATETVVRPLIQRHRLATKSADALRREGRSEADHRRDMSWPALLEDMVTNFPVFVTELEAVEHLVPPADRPQLRLLTAHEVAAVRFATRETAGDPDSFKPLEDYLAACAMHAGA
ncbi:MAG: hypothetical protein R3D57_13430 [Hyphomicrobiaceae bacterium]